MAKSRGIYVEIAIRSSVDEIWHRTQAPEVHEQWDLRFTTIEYLPRKSDSEPQKFLYSTRLGFGLKIDGEGESTGTRAEASGSRTSALSFWSEDPKSLISKGSGYWNYIPAGTSVRFVTWYDYGTRFGTLGTFIDGLLFRPLIGWATAWSFDRLRLWIEDGISPRTCLRMAVMHAAARLCIAFVWIWQGLMPKLLFPSADEKLMLAAAGAPLNLLPWIGAAEIMFGMLTLAFWRSQRLFILNAILMFAAIFEVALRSRSFLFAAFNPVALNLAVIALSLIGYLSTAQVPFASRCLRQRPK